MSLIQMSIRGGVMVGVVWLFRFLFRGRISGRFFSVLWLLVALRLTLPFAVPSQAGIYGLLWRIGCCGLFLSGSLPVFPRR